MFRKKVKIGNKKPWFVFQDKEYYPSLLNLWQYWRSCSMLWLIKVAWGNCGVRFGCWIKLWSPAASFVLQLRRPHNTHEWTCQFSLRMHLRNWIDITWSVAAAALVGLFVVCKETDCVFHQNFNRISVWDKHLNDISVKSASEIEIEFEKSQLEGFARYGSRVIAEFKF